MMRNFVIFGTLAIFIKLVFFFIPDPKPDLTGLPTDEVILYSTSWCGYCSKARDLMDKEGIEYTEYDIEKSREARSQYEQLRGRGVPLMLVNGEVVKGYDPRRLKALW